MSFAAPIFLHKILIKSNLPQNRPIFNLKTTFLPFHFFFDNCFEVFDKCFQVSDNCFLPLEALQDAIEALQKDFYNCNMEVES
jgi:hypothetical protein